MKEAEKEQVQEGVARDGRPARSAVNAKVWPFVRVFVREWW
jgi:hypothetical protein